MRETPRTRGSEQGAFIVDRNETILAFDQAMETLTGWPSVEVVGRNKIQPVGRGDFPLALPLYEGEIPMAGPRNVELTLHCSDGRRLEVEAAADPLPGPGERMKITTLRVVARSSAMQAGVPDARLDPLTGLGGSDIFAQRLHDAYRSAADSARPLGLILLDVDRLREVNDRYGRRTGDRILERIAGILRVEVDDDHRLARLSDDDFAILMPGAGRGEARQLAASLRSTVESFRFFQDEEEHPEIQITVSLGAASFPADSDSPSDLMDRARDALDEARSMGRNRVWCYLRRPRVPVQVPVFFDGAEALLVGYTRDLSPSGVFVQTAAPMEIGMRCALAFPLPGCSSKVHVVGHVVRTVPTEELLDAEPVRIPGMGIEFERFGGNSDRRAIEAFLHKNESLTLRPETGPLTLG